MQIILNNSNKKLILKQKLFVGNWDKSTDTNSKKCTDPPSNNKLQGKCYCATILNIKID